MPFSRPHLDPMSILQTQEIYVPLQYPTNACHQLGLWILGGQDILRKIKRDEERERGGLGRIPSCNLLGFLIKIEQWSNAVTFISQISQILNWRQNWKGGEFMLHGYICLYLHALHIFSILNTFTATPPPLLSIQYDKDDFE